jgi:hypothetical protein
MIGRDVFVTSYGTIEAGPLIQDLIEQLRPGLEASKRTKKYKEARRKMDEIEKAVSVLAFAHWAGGHTLEVTD